MVNLMVTSAAFQQTGPLYNYAGAGKIRAAAPDDPSGTTGGIADPSTCMFWCAVAMGAILKGSPVHSVSTGVLRRCPERKRAASDRSMCLNFKVLSQRNLKAYPQPAYHSIHKSAVKRPSHLSTCLARTSTGGGVCLRFGSHPLGN